MGSEFSCGLGTVIPTCDDRYQASETEDLRRRVATMEDFIKGAPETFSKIVEDAVRKAQPQPSVTVDILEKKEKEEDSETDDEPIQQADVSSIFVVTNN